MVAAFNGQRIHDKNIAKIQTESLQYYLLYNGQPSVNYFGSKIIGIRLQEELK